MPRWAIFDNIVRGALRVPLAFAGLQVFAGVLGVLLAIQERDMHLLIACAAGIPVLAVSIVGMWFRQAWAATLAGILNVVAIGDTVVGVLTMPRAIHLTGYGIALVIFLLLVRVVVLGAFAAAYFRGSGQIRSATRYYRQRRSHAHKEPSALMPPALDNALMAGHLVALAMLVPDSSCPPGDNSFALPTPVVQTDHARAAPPFSWWDRQFAGFGLVAKIILPLLCNGAGTDSRIGWLDRVPKPAGPGKREMACFVLWNCHRLRVAVLLS